ncbi:MAG: uracil-DNA glycosylase [Lentimonas sp.]
MQPKVIIALGRAVVVALFGDDEAKQFGGLRGKWKTFAGIPVIVSFNPSYLLQHDTLKTKRMVWEDLLQVMERLELPISEKQRTFFLPKQ